MQFTLSARDPASSARTGRLLLPRGTVETPAFLPVGTQATVKGLTPRDLREIGVEIVLANAYHLMLRPGEAVVQASGGISSFMGWGGPVLTDSGGFQVFSLAHLRRVTAEGVLFRSHIDGREIFLTPERAVEIQEALGGDIIMALDECPPGGAGRAQVAESLERTHDWARRSLAAQRTSREEQVLFPIVQGGIFLDLRTQSVEALGALAAPGYAIGGVSVGEGPEEMRAVVEHTAAILPKEKPRYLMGVGHPRDLLMGIGAGVDMFDCVLPTRNGRNGQALTSGGPVNLRNLEHSTSRLPIDSDCSCYACRHFTRSYIRHLFLCGEMLASELASLHNVRFLVGLMERAREAIRGGSFRAFAQDLLDRYETDRNRA
ncbi:MAG: tRNA guanosine(34) transglycosylase Tgt [Planctomycetota bacterium]